MTRILLGLVLTLTLHQTVEAAILPITWGPSNGIKIPDHPHDQFPSVEGINLEGKHYQVPEELSGNYKILLVPFKRKQQGDVDTWIRALTDWIKENDQVELYELPTMKRFSWLMRFNINNGMRYGIDNQSSREHTVCMYLDKESFKQRLEITTEDQIYTFLLNERGKVLWRSNGIAEPEKIKQIKTLINDLIKS